MSTPENRSGEVIKQTRIINGKECIITVLPTPDAETTRKDLNISGANMNRIGRSSKLFGIELPTQSLRT
jgi:hypothetical protein